MKLSLQDICVSLIFVMLVSKLLTFFLVVFLLPLCILFQYISHYELINGRDVTKTIFNLFVHYLVFVHPYTRDSVDCGVMEGMQFDLVLIREIPGFGPPKKNVERPCNVYPVFDSEFNILAAEEMPKDSDL